MLCPGGELLVQGTPLYSCPILRAQLLEDFEDGIVGSNRKSLGAVSRETVEMKVLIQVAGIPDVRDRTVLCM